MALAYCYKFLSTSEDKCSRQVTCFGCDLEKKIKHIRYIRKKLVTGANPVNEDVSLDNQAYRVELGNSSSSNERPHG